MLENVFILFYLACCCYDITTVGAFTAYVHGYKKGGLRRQIQDLRESLHVTLDGRCKRDQINSTKGETGDR